MRPLLRLLLLVLLTGLSLGACRPARPATETEYALPATALTAADSAARGPRGPLHPRAARQYRRNLRAESAARARVLAAAHPPVPRTVRVRDGAFSWSGDAVAVAKKAGPVVFKSDSATLTNQAGATNAVAGKDNTTTQTSTAPAVADWRSTLAARLAGPLGLVLGLAALLALGYALYLLLPVLRRRKTAAAP